MTWKQKTGILLATALVVSALAGCAAGNGHTDSAAGLGGTQATDATDGTEGTTGKSLGVPLTTVPKGTEPGATEKPTEAPTTAPTEPPHTHSYAAAETVAPTCTADGYTVYRCACGDSYNGDYISATGHSWSGWTVIREATISAEGLQSRSCTVCGATEEQTIPQIEFDLEAAMAEAEEWGRQYAVNTYGYTIDYNLSLTNYNGYNSMQWDEIEWILGKDFGGWSCWITSTGVQHMKDEIANLIDDMYEKIGANDVFSDGGLPINIDIYEMGGAVYYAFIY